MAYRFFGFDAAGRPLDNPVQMHFEDDVVYEIVPDPKPITVDEWIQGAAWATAFFYAVFALPEPGVAGLVIAAAANVFWWLRWGNGERGLERLAEHRRRRIREEQSKQHDRRMPKPPPGRGGVVKARFQDRYVTESEYNVITNRLEHLQADNKTMEEKARALNEYWAVLQAAMDKMVDKEHQAKVRAMPPGTSWWCKKCGERHTKRV